MFNLIELLVLKRKWCKGGLGEGEVGVGRVEGARREG